MTDKSITVSAEYKLTSYSSVTKAKDSYLDCYFGDGRFDREVSARMAGIALSEVSEWMLSPVFFAKIERRLQDGAKRRSSMQETMLGEAHSIMEGNITDVFDQSENGNLIIRNIKTLPRSVTAAIKQMDVVRTSVPGRPVEFTECLRIVMHDKTKVMNIIGDYTDVKNTALKTTDSGAPKMVGFSLTIAQPEPKAIEEKSDEPSECGEIPYDSASEAGTDGHADGGGGDT